MKSVLKFFALLLIGGAAFSAPAYADTLGIASAYNLFIFGNATVNTDVEGVVAVGGKLSGSSTIGTTASTTKTAADLIVDGGLGRGGHVNLQRGSAYVGSTHSGLSFNGGSGPGISDFRSAWDDFVIPGLLRSTVARLVQHFRRSDQRLNQCQRQQLHRVHGIPECQ